MNVQKVTELKDLVPGALYCTFLRADHNGQSDRDGPFVYWTGGQFVTEDGDDADDIEPVVRSRARRSRPATTRSTEASGSTTTVKPTSVRPRHLRESKALGQLQTPRACRQIRPWWFPRSKL